MNLFTRTIGRFLFAIPFLVFGIVHFINAHGMSAMVPQWIPGGLFWVLITGVGMIAASFSIMIQKWDRIATLLLGIMLLIFVLTIHLPSLLDEPMAVMSDLLKDISLAGASLLYAGYIASKPSK